MPSLRTSLFIVILLFSNFSTAFSQETIQLRKLVLSKCYAVKDSLVGFYRDDSSFVYHGTFSEYNRGKLFVDGVYNFGLKQGVWRKFFPDGKLCTKGMYIEDLPHGAWKYYYDTDTLAGISYYNKGKKVGLWIGYAYNGKKQMTQEHDTSGRLICETFFYPNNGRIAHTDSVFYSGSDSIVSQNYFYENGQLFIRRTRINNKTTGNYWKYYKNGNLWEHLLFKDNHIVGVLKMNDSAGKPKNYGTFKDSVGVLKRYHLNGKLWEESTYRGDLTSYSQQYYDKAGLIYSRGSFIGGKPDSLWTIYDGGRKLAVIDFLNGHDHVRINVYWSNGLLETIKEYKNGLASGQWSEFDSYGKNILRRNFEMGYLHGEFEGAYGLSGIKGKGFYSHGNAIGKWDFLNASNERYLYSLDYPGTSVIDTTGLTGQDYDLPIASYCMSEYDHSGFLSESGFYENDENCVLWNANQKQQRLYEGRHIPNGIVEVGFKIGLLGEVKDVRIIRSFDETQNAKVMEMVYNIPFLRPELYGGIPTESASTFTWRYQYKLPE